MIYEWYLNKLVKEWQHIMEEGPGCEIQLDCTLNRVFWR